ncbi:hypothetical protein [Sinorhizobium americanum]|uniref:Uncharacterized protein n=1 Tax=Sinorhizobium americanum TaxID=194963 RepID=A0A1L3LP08_9HYPH|nr:hypothetical protein [Sinorhizobium americanum]APG91815.1 hypothetical protein SAMCFNEI73_Ch2537 [Sinorhizobium americanum]
MSYSLMIIARATGFYENSAHVYALVGIVQQHAARVAQTLPQGTGN